MAGWRRSWLQQGVACALCAAAALFGPAVAQDLVVRDIPVVAGEVPGELQTIRLRQGDEIALRWTSDADLDLHLHGYDLRLDVARGSIAEMRFLAHAAGRFSVEAHIGSGHRRILYVEVHPE